VLLGRWNWWPSKLSRSDAEHQVVAGDDAPEENLSVPARD
jgi:uncharacterized membrane protein YdfJ with MMPL/SSD domain